MRTCNHETSTSMKRKRKMTWWILAVALIPFVWTFLLIDDWKRDFTTNHAATSPSADDPKLRPVELDLPPTTVAELVTSWVAKHSRWKLESTETDLDGGVRMHLIRSTLIWRFKDDIHVSITPDASSKGSTVTAESRSRIGKGDLGQNPRNLRELLGGLRRS